MAVTAGILSVSMLFLSKPTHPSQQAADGDVLEGGQQGGARGVLGAERGEGGEVGGYQVKQELGIYQGLPRTPL
jgi:hypothetical protein